MQKCIICHRIDVQYTKEHVIPKALGGHYVLQKMVCVDCNSQLGSCVDDALVNHALSKMFRFAHEISGRARNLPNPFAGEHSMQSDPSQSVRIDVDASGHLVPHFITQVKEEDLGGGKVKVNISVDATNEDKLERIVKTKANRLGGSVEEVSASIEKTVIRSDSKIRTHLAIDLQNFKIGLLKIAYEFGVHQIPDYMECSDAKEIAKILREGLFTEVYRYVNIGNGFNTDVISHFSDFLDFEGVKHYLILVGTDAALLCFIHLHKLFTVGVTLSYGPFREYFQIGVNDVEKGEFRILEVWPGVT